MTWIGPIRLTSTIDFQWSWVSWSTVPHAETPAMFITTSMAGWLAWMSAANADHLVEVGDVEHPVLGYLGTQRAGIGDRRRQTLCVPVGEVQLGALGGEFQCGRTADTTGGPVKKQRFPAKPLP